MKKQFCAFNISRQAFINLGVMAADTPFARLRGLLGRVRLRSDEALWVVPSRGIHTVGLMFPIDVIYLDSAMRVIELIEDMRPLSVGPIRLHCASVLQLPLRSIYGSGTQIGDELLIGSPERLDTYWASVQQAASVQPADQVVQRLVRRCKGAVEPIRSMLSERRRSWRVERPGVAASYWTGGRSTPQTVRDIGPGGAYIISSEQFYAGTLVQIVFEEIPPDPERAASHICIASQVNRRTADGFGVRFIFVTPQERRHAYEFLDRVRHLAAVRAMASDVPSGLVLNSQNSDSGADGSPTKAREPNRSPLSHNPGDPALGGSGGQSLVEFALLLPLLLLLIVNVVNFGGMLYAWIAVSNAARTGAQYLVTGPVAAGSPILPAAAAVQTLVLNDVHALPNSPSAQVCVSTSSSATVSCNTGSAPSGAPPAADTAEGSPAITYRLGAVDVTYTYQPFIPLWNFSALGIHATLPPTRIHRQATMRILQ